MRFRTTIRGNGKNTTGIRVPDDVVDALGSGKRPPVRVTVGGHTYRSTVAVMGGTYMVGLSTENRTAAGVGEGDEVDIEIELDDQPREVVVPADFAEALAREPEAAATFGRLSYSNRSWHVLSIDGAKTPETRARRIAKSIEALREGRVR
jgi:hypothetical protein